MHVYLIKVFFACSHARLSMRSVCLSVTLYIVSKRRYIPNDPTTQVSEEVNRMCPPGNTRYCCQPHTAPPEPPDSSKKIHTCKIFVSGNGTATVNMLIKAIPENTISNLSNVFLVSFLLVINSFDWAAELGQQYDGMHASRNHAERTNSVRDFQIFLL